MCHKNTLLLSWTVFKLTFSDWGLFDFNDSFESSLSHCFICFVLLHQNCWPIFILLKCRWKISKKILNWFNQEVNVCIPKNKVVKLDEFDLWFKTFSPNIFPEVCSIDRYTLSNVFMILSGCILLIKAGACSLRIMNTEPKQYSFIFNK